MYKLLHATVFLVTLTISCGVSLLYKKWKKRQLEIISTLGLSIMLSGFLCVCSPCDIHVCITPALFVGLSDSVNSRLSIMLLMYFHSGGQI